MYLVFDVGGTYIKHALMTADGEILAKGKTKTPARKGSTVQDFVQTVSDVYEEYKADRNDIEGIAMDLPGRIDCERGYVYNGGALSYLKNTPLAELIEEACDQVPVTLENDAKAAALAEVWKGNAKEANNAVVIALGTGVGGGIILDRKVHHGKDMIAGELSYFLTHIDKERLDSYPVVESIENVYDAYNARIPISSTYVATSSLCYRFADKKKLDPDSVTGEQIYRLAAEGDKDALDALDDFYFEVAKLAVSVYMIVNPDVILFGGGISEEPKFLEGVQKYVDKICRLSEMYGGIRLDTCKYRNDSNLLGALYNYLQMKGLAE